MNKPTIGHYASHQRDVTAQEDAALNAALRSSTIKVEHPEIARLRAELAECRSKPQELHLHANGDPTDCRSCQRVYQSGHGYFCGLSYRAVPTVCINGDGYVPADPVRLYETGEA